MSEAEQRSTAYDDDRESDLRPIAPLYPSDRFHLTEGSTLSGGCHCARWTVIDRQEGRIVAFFYRHREGVGYARMRSDLDKGSSDILGTTGVFDIETGLSVPQEEQEGDDEGRG